MPGAWAWSLVRELDPTCHNEDPVQLNKYFLKIIFEMIISTYHLPLFCTWSSSTSFLRIPQSSDRVSKWITWMINGLKTSYNDTHSFSKSSLKWKNETRLPAVILSVFSNSLKVTLNYYQPIKITKMYWKIICRNIK